MHMT